MQNSKIIPSRRATKKDIDFLDSVMGHFVNSLVIYKTGTVGISPGNWGYFTKSLLDKFRCTSYYSVIEENRHIFRLYGIDFDFRTGTTYLGKSISLL